MRVFYYLTWFCIKKKHFFSSSTLPLLARGSMVSPSSVYLSLFLSGRNFSYKPRIRFFWLFCTIPWLFFSKTVGVKFLRKIYIWRYLNKRNQKWPKRVFIWFFMDKKYHLVFLKITENERLHYLFCRTNLISGKISCAWCITQCTLV